MEPAAPAPAKKKMGALGWVLIGCLTILILLGAGFAAVTFVVARKVKSVAESFEKDPVRAAAELAVRVNPEVELVSTDEAAHTMTIREKATGETVTLDWSEISEGRFRFEADGKELTLDATQTEDGAVVTLQDGTGEALATIGTSAPGGELDWFPRYPGASELSVNYTAQAAEGRNDFFTFTTGDAPEKVLDFYAAALEGKSFETSKTVSTTDGQTGGMVLAWNADRSETLTLVVGREGDLTQVGVNATRKP